MSGDTTEQAAASAASHDDLKPISECDTATDKEVDMLMSLATPADVANDTSVPCSLPPSPPMDVDQTPPLLSDCKPVSEVDDALQASSCGESAGYISCNSSMLASTDDAPDDLHPLSAASKYRLRCQCGAKNCRQYLY